MEVALLANWLESFEREYCGERVVRGRRFSGAKIEIYDTKTIEVHLTNPMARGETKEDRMYDTLMGQGEYVFAVIPVDRLEGIVSGQDKISDEDWTWDDEV
jgi:hypothetical protein